MLQPANCAWEAHEGEGPGATLYAGTVAAHAGALRQGYAGKVQCVYIDPPFFTGQRFQMRMRVGEGGWSAGHHSLTLPAYLDRWAQESEYLEMMEEALALARELLHPTGTLFLHVDYRMVGKLRGIADALFGADHLMNEIIWAYQSGGRSRRHFSRKHDDILLYRKGARPYFDIDAVAVPRAEHRSNHMRKQVDADGRTFRTIRAGGKEYVYYDDDLVTLSDVWTDISHLQQKDPERTGYDTQKPLKLLERILLCASRPGDLVADLFFGSGTTGVAAAGLGRRFLGVDAGLLSHTVSRKRLLPYQARQQLLPQAEPAGAWASLRPMIGFYEVRLEGYAAAEAEGWAAPLDAVDQWSAGLVAADTFFAYAHAARSKTQPALAQVLEIPMLEGRPALLVADVWGRRQVYLLDPPAP